LLLDYEDPRTEKLQQFFFLLSSHKLVVVPKRGGELSIWQRLERGDAVNGLTHAGVLKLLTHLLLYYCIQRLLLSVVVGVFGHEIQDPPFSHPGVWYTVADAAHLSCSHDRLPHCPQPAPVPHRRRPVVRITEAEFPADQSQHVRGRPAR